MQLTNTLWLIVQGLLIIALPVVIAAAFQHLRLMTQQLRMRLSEEQQQNIDRAIATGVKFAEQTGIVQSLTGPEKKKQAIQIAQKFLDDRGIKLDVDKLSTLIEAEVVTQFRNPTPVADTPQARQQLIDSAIQTAVQAAEQGGLTGLIQNLGPQKQAYAVQLALQYLGQIGVRADPQVVSSVVASRMPASPAPMAAFAPPAPQPEPLVTAPPQAVAPAYTPPSAPMPPIQMPPQNPAGGPAG